MPPLRPILRSSLRSSLLARSLGLAQFVLPNHCPLCGNLTSRKLCAACEALCWNEPRLRCTQCAMPLASVRWGAARGHRPGQGRAQDGDRYRCGDCIDAPPAFDATFALGDYRAPLDLLARDLKFHARLALGKAFAERLAAAAADAPGSAGRPDLIVPVPLARARLVSRGYNQAWEIARPLARALGVQADAALARRTHETAPQSRLDRDTRRRNMAHAFALTKPVRGLHVGVVDDVMTSGATLHSLAHTLKAAGARRVTNFVGLRTPKD